MYGILISLAIFIAATIAEKIRKREGVVDHEHLWGLILYTIVLGVIGARIYHVLGLFSYYRQDPIRILQIWHGGLGIFGGMFGGIIGILLYTHKHKLNFLYWLDLVSIVTPLAQAIARWGNFFNHELFGPPTTLPWGITIPAESRPEQFAHEDTFHPLFLYESLANLALFFVLMRVNKKHSLNMGSGFFTAIYLTGYSTIRFFLEFLKIDPWKIGQTNVAQAICVALIIFSTMYMIGVLKFKHHDIHS